MQTLPKPPKLSKDGRGPLSSKNGSIAAAVVTALIAGIIIVVFLNQYRAGVNNDGVPTPVVVAQQLIEKGASGDVAGKDGLFKTTEVPRDQLKAGAVTDPAALKGKVAVAQIVPGQQVTATDFALPGNGLVTQLAADERAITIAVDTTHGSLGKIVAGDHVDVLAGLVLDSGAGAQRPIIKIIMQDVPVLAVPAAGAGGGVAGGGGAPAATGVTLRVPTTETAKLAFAADNGKIWLTLRPQDGASLPRTPLVGLTTLLADTKPLKVSP
jgi:Flp pilus assembly protein CpaB